jgi:hypothetical protein
MILIYYTFSLQQCNTQSHSSWSIGSLRTAGGCFTALHWPLGHWVWRYSRTGYGAALGMEHCTGTEYVAALGRDWVWRCTGYGAARLAAAPGVWEPGPGATSNGAWSPGPGAMAHGAAGLEPVGRGGPTGGSGWALAHPKPGPPGPTRPGRPSVRLTLRHLTFIFYVTFQLLRFFCSLVRPQIAQNSLSSWRLASGRSGLWRPPIGVTS